MRSGLIAYLGIFQCQRHFDSMDAPVITLFSLSLTDSCKQRLKSLSDKEQTLMLDLTFDAQVLTPRLCENIS